MKDNKDVSARKLIDRLVPDPAWGTMQGLLATTYELRPDFLEMDFLPSVFGLGSWDDRSWSTRIALEKRLFELDAAVVFTEAARYHGRPRSLRLDVRPTVSSRGSVLHAKVTLLLFERAVRLIIGSANLTKQGYRENREVVAVLTAHQKSQKEAELIKQGLAGMETALSPWLTPEARKLIRRSLETLQPWLIGSTEPDAAFLWTNGQNRLWREFVGRWPAGESVKRVSIISPFWSQDANLTLSSFLSELKRVGGLAPQAEARLLTDAFQNPDGKLIPILPPAYVAQDWNALGVKATVQAVDPKVHPEELGGMEGFTGTRSLHAKVVLVEGHRSALAYLGSANFTAHGWGFLPSSASANTEAGLILRGARQSAVFDSLLPDLVGEPVVLADADIRAIRAPEIGPADEPWPEFIHQILLAPTASNTDQLTLCIETVDNSAAFLWHCRFLDRDGIPGETLVPLERTKDPGETAFAVTLSPETLTRLLTDQEVLVCWNECPAGRPFPLNVEASARVGLPISPGKESLEEHHLLSYYQGRIAWEELFPDPDPCNRTDTNSGNLASIDTGVDKSRIQSYQIREFVEALVGVNQDLARATQSASAMRLALLGPVSPAALAETILDAVAAGRRTPTAAGFQLVEILACLKAARSNHVPDRLAIAWKEYLRQTAGKIWRLLDQLLADHADLFASNKAFLRYREAILGDETTLTT